MDLTTSLIGLALVAVALLPIIYFSLAQKKVKNKFISEFLALAAQKQLNITQYDVWGHYCAIGLDTQSNKLFYYRKKDDQIHYDLINLSEVERCSVANIKKALNEDQVIDRLGLVFNFRNLKQAGKTLPFFIKEESMTLDNELLLVEKWRTQVNTRISARPEHVMITRAS